MEIYNKDTMQATTFGILTETFIHTIYMTTSTTSSLVENEKKINAKVYKWNNSNMYKWNNSNNRGRKADNLVLKLNWNIHA